MVPNTTVAVFGLCGFHNGVGPPQFQRGNYCALQMWRGKQFTRMERVFLTEGNEGDLICASCVASDTNALDHSTNGFIQEGVEEKTGV
jgi:hypothetical protein